MAPTRKDQRSGRGPAARRELATRPVTEATTLDALLDGEELSDSSAK